VGKEDLTKRLEQYKSKHNLTYRQVAERLDVHEVNIYRWKKAKKITGAYARIVKEFLEHDKS